MYRMRLWKSRAALAIVLAAVGLSLGVARVASWLVGVADRVGEHLVAVADVLIDEVDLVMPTAKPDMPPVIEGEVVSVEYEPTTGRTA